MILSGEMLLWNERRFFWKPWKAGLLWNTVSMSLVVDGVSGDPSFQCACDLTTFVFFCSLYHKAFNSGSAALTAIWMHATASWFSSSCAILGFSLGLYNQNLHVARGLPVDQYPCNLFENKAVLLHAESLLQYVCNSCFLLPCEWCHK